MQYLVYSSFDFDDDETIIDQLITKNNGVVVAKVPDDMFLVFELSRSKLRCFELVPFIDMPLINFLRDEAVDMREMSKAVKLMRQEEDKQEGSSIVLLTDNIPPPPYFTVTVESIDEPGTTYEVIMYEGTDGNIVYIPDDGDEVYSFPNRESMEWFGTDRIVGIAYTESPTWWEAIGGKQHLD